MVKGMYIAIGFIPTMIALYVLSAVLAALLNTNVYALIFIYCFTFISLLICITTGIILIKKGYKNIGIGGIAALICYYIFLLMLYWMMQGPM